MGWGQGRLDGCGHQLGDPVLWGLMLGHRLRQVHTHVYAENSLRRVPPIHTSALCSHYPPPSLDASYSQKPKGHREPDRKPLVPRGSQVSAGAMPECWLGASEAKVSKSLAGWWEGGSRDNVSFHTKPSPHSSAPLTRALLGNNIQRPGEQGGGLG